MRKLEKTIIENGITYKLGADELYYPDFEIPEGTHYNIGKFGRMKGEFLKEYKHSQYMKLLLSGKLNQYLHEFEEECNEMMNNIRTRAEEMVVRITVVKLD